MHFGRVYAVLLRILYLMRGSVTRLVSPIVWPVLDIVLWGFISRYISQVSQPGFNFATAFLGAALLWEFFNRAAYGATMAFFEDVWSRNFLNLFSSPITIVEYLTGLVLAGSLTAVIASIIMIALTALVFGLSLGVMGLLAVPFMLILYGFGIALGIVGISIVLRFGPTAEWFIWPMPMVLAPFAAVFYPVATLPKWMQYISATLPASYVFEGMRGLLAGHPPEASTLLIGGGIDILDIILACWLFHRMYIRAVQTGLIARYSAESIS